MKIRAHRRIGAERAELPLNEVGFDFYDRLNSISRGYARFDYLWIGYCEGDLVKMASSAARGRKCSITIAATRGSIASFRAARMLAPMTRNTSDPVYVACIAFSIFMKRLTAMTSAATANKARDPFRTVH